MARPKVRLIRPSPNATQRLNHSAEEPDLPVANAGFRAEVRRLLAIAMTDDLRLAGRRTTGLFAVAPDGQRWFRILAARGCSVPHWPRPWAGRAVDWQIRC